MRTIAASGMGLILFSSALAFPALAATSPAIHQFDDLALSPMGDKTATVESDDPGNLTEEPHGAVIVRDAAGKSIGHSDPVWSPKGDALLFLATDEKAGKTTLYRAATGAPQSLAVISGVANTPRYSSDGGRIALLVT